MEGGWIKSRSKSVHVASEQPLFIIVCMFESQTVCFTLPEASDGH